jgi:hypothetical protein
MRKIYTLLFILIVSAPCLFSQNKCACLVDNPSEELLEDKILAQNYSLRVLSPEIQFYNDWTLGDIMLTSGSVIHNKLLRYNGFMDALFWMRKKDYQAAVIEKNTIASFLLYNDEHEPYAFFKRLKIKNLFGKDSSDVFLEVLTEGKLSLYAWRKVGVINNVDEYSSDYRFYLWKDGIMYPLGLRQRSLLKLMGAEKPIMRGIIRENNLNVSNESQMIKAIELYNKR